MGSQESPNDPTISSRQRFDSFNTINEMPVDDISLQFFYKPHTITLLAISIGIVIYTAFVRLVYLKHFWQ